MEVFIVYFLKNVSLKSDKIKCGMGEVCLVNVFIASVLEFKSEYVCDGVPPSLTFPLSQSPLLLLTSQSLICIRASPLPGPQVPLLLTVFSDTYSGSPSSSA